MIREDSSHFIAQRLQSLAGHYGHLCAMKSLKSLTITFAELSSLVCQYSRLFSDSTVAARSPILIYAPHGVAKAVAISALLAGGRPGMAVSSRTPAAEVQALVNKYAFGAILTTPYLAAKLQSSLPGKTFNFSPAQESLSMTLLVQDSLPSRLKASTAWLLLTSGSTGMPKAVEISEENLRERTDGEIELLGLQRGDKIMNCLSFAHDLGLNQLLTMLARGASITVSPSAFAKDLLAQLGETSFAGITGTPLLWTELLQLKPEVFASIDYRGYLTVSGGSLPKNHLVKLREVFPNARIIKTYGQTETFRTLYDDRQDLITNDSAGRPIAGVTARLVDDDFKLIERPGVVGQLVHCGPGTMTGYVDDPILSHEKLGDGGVLTGDYFKRSVDGDFYFVGRRDDMIKHFDHRIYLSEIQNTILKIPGVSNAIVMCVPNNKPRSPDRKLVAWYTSPDLSATRLRESCLAIMANYKVPEEFYSLDSFPKTASAKIDRRALLASIGLEEM